METSNETVKNKVVTGLTKIGMAIKSHAWQDAELQKLTPTQGQVLSLLRSRRNVGLRLSEIAEGLGITSATASDTVRVLVDKKLVQKGKAEDDGRAIAIKMTEKGENKADSIASSPDFLLNALDELSCEEQAIFYQGLTKILRKLQENNEIPLLRMCVTCHFFQENLKPESDKPHYCKLVEEFFGDRNLKIDCPEHIAQTI
ncbi:MAG: MarR family winged helix-turn-helix transcriptional regulator [Crocosphaera sp.]|nr:MarR family winged helix-turn-helix transcriptional regulator [Crocosphaera sp.]